MAAAIVEYLQFLITQIEGIWPADGNQINNDPRMWTECYRASFFHLRWPLHYWIVESEENLMTT